MTLRNIEKLHTSVVILPEGEFEVKLSRSDLMRIVREPQAEFAPPPIGTVKITSMRDQIEITVVPGRIQILDHGDALPGTDRFPQIVAEFATLLTQTGNAEYRAFGWNFDIAFSLDKEELPAKVIADKFINQEVVRKSADLKLSGGGVRLFYSRESARCALYLEPRENRPDATRFYAHTNVHFEIAESFPSCERLAQSFKEEYDAFISIVSAMID